uniref:hypothetical protein n=1 Tax=Candidatus Scatousia sp. TaxID=3085663 RepID=UPI004026019F
MHSKIISSFLIVLIVGFSTVAVAKSIRELNKFERAMYDGRINYYKSVKSCQKGTFKLPSMNFAGTELDMVLYVLGRKNNKCSIREHLGNSDIRCELPMDVAEKYGDEGMRTLNESVEKGSSYSQYINQIINDTKYCQQFN